MATIGNTASSTNYASFNLYGQMCGKVTMPVGGTVTKIAGRFDGDGGGSGTVYYKLSLWKADGESNRPSTFLRATSEITVAYSGATTAWYEADLTSPVAITAADYWLVCSSNVGATFPRLMKDDATGIYSWCTGTAGNYADPSSASWTTGWGGLSNVSYLCIYATYEIPFVGLTVIRDVSS